MTTEVQEKKVNKSQFVRNYLKEIGALTDNPPEGWRKQVEDALAKENIKMASVTIYQIRSKALQSKKASAKSKNLNNNLTVDSLASVRDFAKTVGGLDNLSHAIDFLRSIRN